MFDQEKRSQRIDHSNKGKIDEEIKAVCDKINSHKDYFTTSSCSGRILLLQKGRRKCDNEFLYETHETADFSEVKKALNPIGDSPIWFKQEAVIVHVVCRDIASAERILRCARDSGLKHSGALALENRVVVEIIGTDAMETIVARDGEILVDEAYLKILVEEANKKMERNRGRIELLKENLKLALTLESHN